MTSWLPRHTSFSSPLPDLPLWLRAVKLRQYHKSVGHGGAERAPIKQASKAKCGAFPSQCQVVLGSGGDETWIAAPGNEKSAEGDL